MSPHQKRKLRISGRLIIFGIAAGLFFVILNDGINDLYPLINGALIGFLIGIIASVFELYIYEGNLRKQPFIIILATRSVYYTILIIFIIVSEIGIARMIKDHLNLTELLYNEAFNYYLYEGEFVTTLFYTFALIIIISFSRQVSRKLGHGVLIGLITGRNYHPRELEKIFMFLNMPFSDKIIKQIGRMEFHQFINEIVYDITLPVLNNYGTIYQYVEDEMVISWKMKTGIRNTCALRCFFDIKDKIHENKEKYLKKYGVSPVINAAIHCGKVVKGEIGFVKTEIVYHGDIMNTTSRILDACARLQKDILVSASFLELITLPVIYNSAKCGDVKLKGKKKAIELYEISEIDIKSMQFE